MITPGEAWTAVGQELEKHLYMSGVVRSANRVTRTAEFFTPVPLVLALLQRVPEAALAPGAKALDPACGDGQFLVAVKFYKMFRFGLSEQVALDDIYGVDLMPDNVVVCRKRLGGGTILVGDALHPHRRVPGQTAADYELLRELLGEARSAVA